MKTKILYRLKEKNDFISGQELCDEFNVSRTAIWKAINNLKKEGYEIESVTNKGYRLITVPDLLKEDAIREFLNTEYIAQEIRYFETIDSTNSECKRIAESGLFHNGLLVITNRQDAGRGRRGRGWVCPSGVNIAMSLLLKPDISPDRASMLTIVMAMAVARASKMISNLDVAIKWPNDIVLSGKKICGILTEMSAEPDYIHYVVIGVGVNVNQTGFDDEIKDVASSLKNEGGEDLNRAKLTALIMNEFERLYDEFIKVGDLRIIKDEYNKLIVSLNKEVRVLDPKGEYSGISLGINDVGELLIKKENGDTENVFAGEVSVRGIYGYV